MDNRVKLLGDLVGLEVYLLGLGLKIAINLSYNAWVQSILLK